MCANAVDEHQSELGALVDAIEAIPESPLTEWYNAIRQPTEGVEAVFVSLRFGEDGIDRVSVNEVTDETEIYSPWADLTLALEPEPFVSKAEFRERVRERASEKLD